MVTCNLYATNPQTITTQPLGEESVVAQLIDKTKNCLILWVELADDGLLTQRFETDLNFNDSNRNWNVLIYRKRIGTVTYKIFIELTETIGNILELNFDETLVSTLKELHDLIRNLIYEIPPTAQIILNDLNTLKQCYSGFTLSGSATCVSSLFIHDCGG